MFTMTAMKHNFYDLSISTTTMKASRSCRHGVIFCLILKFSGLKRKSFTSNLFVKRDTFRYLTKRNQKQRALPSIRKSAPSSRKLIQCSRVTGPAVGCIWPRRPKFCVESLDHPAWKNATFKKKTELTPAFFL